MSLETFGTRVVRMLGHDFRFEGDDPTLVDHLGRAWAHLDEGDFGAATVYSLIQTDDGWRPSVGTEATRDWAEPSRALGWLLWRLNQGIAGSVGPDHLLLHAGLAVAGERGVVVVAPADRGKSTLTTGLATRGMAYGGDEFVALSLIDGLIDPVPRPPVIEGPARDLFATSRPRCADGWFETQWLLDPNLLPGGVATARVKPALLVVPRYVTGAAAEVTELCRSDVVVLLLEQTFNLASVRRAGLAASALLARTVPCVSIVSGDLQGSCDAIEKLLAA